MVAVLARYAARYSVRANDVTVDATLLWVGVVLAVAAAVLLAFVPRLPSSDSARGLGLSSGSVRITTGTNRRLKMFAITQIAASFLLLAGAGMLVTALLTLQRQQTGFRGNVLAMNVPVVSYTRKPEAVAAFYKEAIRRISVLPGVEQVALGTVVPWRDPGFFAAQFTAEGYRKANGEEDPRAQFRTVSPGFFSALGLRLIAGRDFNDGDRHDGERVVIVSQSLAQRMFPNMDAVNRRLMWTDPVTKFIGVSNDPRRIVGVVPDIDDENIVPVPTMTIYHPMEQEMNGGRLFVHAKMDPYTLVPPITRIIRDLASDQPVERAADARRHPRGGALADARQRAGVQRLRRRRAGHCRRRRGRRARVLRQRPDARVRCAPGDRSDAFGPARPHPQGGCADWRQRHRRRCDRRAHPGPGGQPLHRRDRDSRRGAAGRRGPGADCRGPARVADAGGAGFARRGRQRAARGLSRPAVDRVVDALKVVGAVTRNWQRNQKAGVSDERPQPFSYLAAGIVIFVALMASPFNVPVSSTWWPAWAAMVFELWLTSA